MGLWCLPRKKAAFHEEPYGGDSVSLNPHTVVKTTMAIFMLRPA
jgi:hypothetical protein